MFIHEVGHNLFNGTHYGGANTGVVANNFYTNSGMWGGMNLEKWHNFNVANGWERWFMGWVPEIKSMGRSNSKLTYPLNNDVESFILRDYFTTGDVVVIEIPKDTLGGKQRVCNELHTF